VAGASAWLDGCYLRGPDIVTNHITRSPAPAGRDHVPSGRVVRDRRRSSCVPAIIIFMPIITKLTEVNINRCMGVVIIGAGLRLIRRPRALALVRRKCGYRREGRRSLAPALCRIRDDRLPVAFPTSSCGCRSSSARIVGCFKAPDSDRYICP
jgi:hypothetical protein